MPKLVVKVDHTKTKKKIQKENKILVKEKNEDRHVGFKAYGDDGETHRLCSTSGDPPVHAASAPDGKTAACGVQRDRPLSLSDL